jgi:cation-transporting ATPase 13A1
MGKCISDRNPDADFSPNLLNSVVFLVTTSATFATFAANYKGRPYMTPFTSNKPLMYTLLAGVASLWAAALELMPDFNDYLQMTKMPDWGFKLEVPYPSTPKP